MTTQATPVPARPAPPPVARFILLTGASGGIGRATTVRLADTGHLVFAAARRAGELQALAAAHPGIRPVLMDITDAAAIDRACHQITDQTGGYGLDVLVNAAGILALGPVEAVPEQQTRAQLEANLFGTLAVTQAFLPPMRQRGAGRIVNVSSILGRFALPGSGLYAASRFALEAASDALRIELAPFGVQVVVVVVEPGVIATALYQRAAAALPGDDQALGATAPAGRGGSGSPSGCCTGGLLLAGRWLAARPPSAGRWPTRRPGTARPPGSATRAVSCSRCAQRPDDRPGGHAVPHPPIPRREPAPPRPGSCGPAPCPRLAAPARPSTTQATGSSRTLFAPLTNAARRNHHADLASRQDVLRAQLMVGARATQDHQQAIGIAN
jgi:NAD(P)-dependent dehydrogenase (short-subunit alcohol dehydrogenase family)